MSRTLAWRTGGRESSWLFQIPCRNSYYGAIPSGKQLLRQMSQTRSPILLRLGTVHSTPYRLFNIALISRLHLCDISQVSFSWLNRPFFVISHIPHNRAYYSVQKERVRVALHALLPSTFFYPSSTTKPPLFPALRYKRRREQKSQRKSHKSEPEKRKHVGPSHLRVQCHNDLRWLLRRHQPRSDQA